MQYLFLDNNENDKNIDKYSQNCEQRPSKGETEHGLYRHVDSIWWFIVCFK